MVKSLALLCLCVAAAASAPSYPIGHVAHVADSVHAGPAVARTHVEHGVVGQRAVPIGTRTHQVGHTYHVAGQSVHRQAPYSFVAGAPTVSSHTAPIYSALPAPAPPAAIPPPPRNLGPAPANAVVRQLVPAVGRTHTVVTPRRTQIVPEVHVNRYPVEVPVAVPVPVERVVEHTRHESRPYAVEVPRPVPVHRPYKVHPVKHVVETPVVHTETQAVRQPVVHHRSAAVGQLSVPVHQAYAHKGYGLGVVASAGGHPLGVHAAAPAAAPYGLAGK